MQLVRYEHAKTALSEAVAVDEVKDVRDKSIAVAAYAKQADDRELEINARELRLRAERRLGQLIAPAGPQRVKHTRNNHERDCVIVVNR